MSVTATVGLAALAGVFVFVCGANDGGALLAVAVRQRDVAATIMLAMLVCAIVAGPALFGLAVARTFTERLAATDEPSGPLVMTVAVAVAVALVLVLTWRGVPTSVTLAIIGALAGAGLGFGLAPPWSSVTIVLAVGAAAPLIGGAIGYLLGVAARRIPTTRRLPAAVRLAHIVAFGGQCLAYAANDGQKMFAVVTVAVTAAHGHGLDPLVLLALAAVFAAGALTSLRRISRGTAFNLSPPRPWQLVSAEVASSAAVLGTAVISMPVSMTQSVAASLVGAGASQGVRRVRWQYALPVLTSWLITLPASFAVAALVGLVLGRLE